MTLVVLGLDALDYGLVDHWNMDAYELEHAVEMTTLTTDARDYPFTLEVWPAIATGLPPEEHGVVGSDTSEWDNPVVDFLSGFTGRFPESTRRKLGDVAEALTGADYGAATTTADTMFDREAAAVFEWPGVVDSPLFLDVWEAMKAASSGEMDRTEFERVAHGEAGAKFGWVDAMLDRDLSVVATHVHVLDGLGHAYADDEAAYRAQYEAVAERVASLCERLGDDDELLVLSDHGMQVQWLDDDEPGAHSWRATAATTLDRAPPEHVLGVRDWVDEHASASAAGTEELDMPVERLREMGYLE